MEEKYLYLILGVVLGWVTKIPFLIKWYKELKKTRSYEKMRDKVHLYEMIEKYNNMYPNSQIKQCE